MTKTKTKKPPVMKIQRTGKFFATLSGPTHCGLAMPNRWETKQLDYLAYICIDGGLDAKGFIIDNKVFKDYFDSVTDLYMSCEELAASSARHFYREAIKARSAASIVEVCVQIWGLPGEAFAEFKYTRP